MSRHALLWCGWWRPQRPQHRLDRGPQRIDLDFPASVRDLDMAVRAAKALGVRSEDIHAFVCRDDLLPQDFDESHQHPATIEELRRVTAAIARQGSPDDALLFVATNHGAKRGLLTSAPVDEFDEDPTAQVLTPSALASCLDPLPGQQVLLLAACYAGIFRTLGSDNRRAVLSACSEDQTYRVQADPACSPFLLEMFQAWCGVGLQDNVRPRLATDLATAFAQAAQRLTQEYEPEFRNFRPLLQGSASWPR